MPLAQVATQNIFYVEKGSPGTAVVFVHGAGSNHLVWGLQVRALGEVTRTIALDLPGHGRSDPPGRDSIEGYRDAVLGLLDALEIERAIVIGHSMGGAIAQALALSHPNRVSALGLIGTGARLRVLPTILEGVSADYDAVVKLVVDYSYASVLDPEFRKRAEDELRACPPHITLGDYTACNSFDVMPRLSGIQSPSLVVCGREDRMTPAKYSVFLASNLPNAHLVFVDHAGHSVMLEQPDEVNKTLLDFVGSLKALP
jgi:pimeloyl-ACP methyl ester carboxylesterase